MKYLDVNGFYFYFDDIDSCWYADTGGKPHRCSTNENMLLGRLYEMIHLLRRVTSDDIEVEMAIEDVLARRNNFIDGESAW